MLNGAYHRAARALMPRALGASCASVCFDPEANPLASGAAFLHALPTLLGAAPLIVVAAFIELAAAAAAALCSSWLGCVLALALILSLVNALQSGRAPPPPPPRVATVEEVLRLRRKSDFVALWRAGTVRSPAPTAIEPRNQPRP